MTANFDPATPQQVRMSGAHTSATAPAKVKSAIDVHPSTDNDGANGYPGGDEPGRNGSTAPRPTVVQVEAAKLRLVTDRRLGKTSPEWLRRVAKGLPPQPVAAAH